MLELLKPFWGVIVKYGAIISGILFFWLGARKSGEQAIKQKNIEQTLKDVQVRNETENNIAASSDDKLAELRQKWIK